MQRRTRLLALLTLCLLASSCELGQFAVSNSLCQGLFPQTCELWLIRGGPINSFGQRRGSDQTLLCVLVLCPGVEPHGSSGIHDDGIFSSRYSSTWSTDSGDVSFSFTWNRQSDTMSVLGFHFRRSAGNALLVRRDSKGVWSAQQLSNISSDADSAKALKEMQQQIPDDPLIASLNMPQ